MTREDPETLATPLPEPGTGYIHWSRDPAVGLFAVMPLWLLYELLRMSLVPGDRNGAEHLLLSAFRSLWPPALDILRVLFLALVAGCAVSLIRRSVPWARVALVSALEGSFYGLLLGPIAIAIAAPVAGVLVHASPAVLAAGSAEGVSPLVGDLIGSLGAGIFEELVFRLGLVSLLALLFHRIGSTFAMPREVSALAAIVVAALLFAWFHHLPPASEPFHLNAFLFRSAAGLILGTLFVLRGIGVAVYTHAMYDVVFYLERGVL